MTATTSTIAIIGASPDRTKYGNKALRAYLESGAIAIPINPHHTEIEGQLCYASILDVPEAIDIASFYVPAQVGLQVIEEVARKGIPKVLFNPGSESQSLMQRADELGLQWTLACSILLAGRSPAEF